MEIRDHLYSIQNSIGLLKPELILVSGIILLIVVGFFKPKHENLSVLMATFLFSATVIALVTDTTESTTLFAGMIRKDKFTGFLQVLLNLSGLLTCIMALNKTQIKKHRNEFSVLLLAVVFGGHFFLMSNNLLLTFLSMELVSIGSYVLATFAFDREASEGGLKYFLFGSVASAVMLYGFSMLYGHTGTLDFTSQDFSSALMDKPGSIILIAGVMSVAGVLFKMSAAPMHPWVPDVYQAAPFPVIAFLSTVPKLAALGAFIKIVLALNAYGRTDYDWQVIVVFLAILSITVGNFAALAQKNAKRLMAFSSIAHSGFLVIGIAAFIPQGLHFTLFYAGIYVLMNFAVFIYLGYFAQRGINTVNDFSGRGRVHWVQLVLLLVGLISLTGLPPTSGFTAKLFIFSSVWESYQLSGKPLLLWLLVLGLLNTVVSLFYYLKIPYYAFLKEEKVPDGPDFPAQMRQNFITPENLLGLILVLLILALFVAPGLLMGWINKVNFVF